MARARARARTPLHKVLFSSHIFLTLYEYFFLLSFSIHSFLFARLAVHGSLSRRSAQFHQLQHHYFYSPRVRARNCNTVADFFCCSYFICSAFAFAKSSPCLSTDTCASRNIETTSAASSQKQRFRYQQHNFCDQFLLFPSPPFTCRSFLLPASSCNGRICDGK